MLSPEPAAENAEDAERTDSKQPDMRFPRSRRILDARVFRELFDQERRYPGSYMVLWPRIGAGTEVRLGVVTSRRSFRRSVDRSLVRRRLREAFRKNRFRIKPGVELILVGRTRMLTADAGAVEAEFLRLTARAGLIRTEELRAQL